jgi:hypothetical protein
MIPRGLPGMMLMNHSQVPNPDSYVHSAVLDNMFNWMLDQGFGVLTELLPNTGAYIKWKNDGTKLQVISDRSEKNKMDLMRPKSFKLFSPEDMKKSRRSGCSSSMSQTSSIVL